ncbi:hypothetical protein AHAS_Ahas19G0272200 [Arachis hypogaea]
MQRFEIVNGVTEVEGIAEEKTAGAEEDEEKGVPAFWLNAMKNNEVLAEKLRRQSPFIILIKANKFVAIPNLEESPSEIWTTYRGIMVQEIEILKIEVKLGWRKGTKIKFEGKGDEKPGYLPADIVFIIEEKKHNLFRREGKTDLEICIEIPLVDALTVCSLPIPILGGEKLNLSFENIVVYPGYVKVIEGQGMPTLKNDGKRGDLHVKLLVDFPKELSDEQRQEAFRILENCC